MIPIFISDDHSATYWAIKHGIKEGFLVPKNTIVLNFDAHEDTYDDGRDFPSYNNWTRVVKEHGMIEEGIWISGEVDRRDIKSLMKGRWKGKEFIPPRNLKGKDIVISICMDYFDDPERLGRLEERMKELVDFMKTHREHIRLITIAYSERWCHYIMSPKEIADNDLCNRLNATIVSVKDLEGNIRREAAIGDVYIFEKQGVIELGRVAAYLDINREGNKDL